MRQFYYNLHKGLFVIVFFTLCCNLAKAQTLTIGTVDTQYPYTPGSSIAVPFTVGTTGGCIKPDNVYKLYISSVPGGTPDTQIGSYTGFYAPFINGVIPSGLAPGSYNLAVTSSNAPATSASVAVSIAAGSPVLASITAPLLNTNYPDVFGNCSGNPNSYSFTNNSTSNSTVTASVFNEISQSGSGNLTFNPVTQNATFNAGKFNYTIFVKAVYNGVEGTKAYQLINNRISSNFGSTTGDPVCLGSNGQGVLVYSIATSGIQNNYPGDLYTVSWGDGTFTQYTLCDLLLNNGNLSHPYIRTSCGTTSNGMINSFQVDAQVSSIICGNLGSPLTTYAKVITAPTNSFTGPQSACLNVPVTFTNTSDPGKDASSSDCVNNNALYTWIIDEGTPNEQQFISYTRDRPFTYTFTTSGNHTVKLRFESQSNTVCGATDFSTTICVLARPQPQFALTASTVCTGSTVAPTDNSNPDQSCASNALNNVYNWTVTGPSTPAFVGGTTAASHQPQFTLSAPGIYTITLSISTESCGAFTTSQTLIVNTTPTVSLSADKAYCGTNQTLTFDSNTGPTQTLFTGTTADQPNTYSWTVTGGVYSFINNTNANSKYPTILFSDFAVYTVTATQTNNCGTASDSQQIEFKQSPTISAGADQVVCPDALIQLAGTITGPTPLSYQWTGGSGTFSDIHSLSSTYMPTNTETLTGHVTLTLQVTTNNPQPCDLITDDVIININPRNTVTSNTTKSICTGTSVSYQPTAQLTGSTFTWTSTVSSGTVTGNTASGSGDINDILTNTNATSNGTVTYTITPFNNNNGVNCPGTSSTLTVTVTPRPVITVNATTNTICSGQTTGITFSSNLPGTTFSWTTTATSNVSGNNSQSVSGNFTGINEVLTNNSLTTDGTVTYTITPTSAEGCTGTPVIVTITVKPAPIQANAGPDQQNCNQTSAQLNGNDPGISTGLWTLVSTQPGVTFANANQYNTVVNGLQGGEIYTFRWTITGASQCSPTQDDIIVNNLSPLTNNISVGQPAFCYGQTITINGDQPTGGTGTYVYSWESSTDNGATWTTINGQNGRDYTFTGTVSISIRRVVTSLPCSSNFSAPINIIVQPPIDNNTIAANQLICYNTTPAQLTGTTPTGADGTYTYQWQSSTDNGVNWLGISNSNTINYQPAALTATTQFRRIVTSALCNGDQQNISNAVTVTVNPQNTNTVTSASTRIICTGTALNYHPTAQQNNTVFTWVSSASSTVSGNSPSGTGDINDVLTNSDLNNNGTVTYTITPVNNNCPGVSFTLTVTVTPIPRVIITNSGNQICSGNQTGITFTTNTPGVMLRWVSDNVQGITGNNNQATSVIATSINDVLTSNLTTPATIVYHITPYSPGGCNGPTVDATVTVLPQPVQANAGSDDQICNATSYTLNGNNPSPSTGMWSVVSGPTNVVFANATQNNTLVSGLQPGQEYTFRWTITSTGACSTSVDDVFIADRADLTNTISFGSPAICYGQAATVLGDQPTGGTGAYVYSWESSTDGTTFTTVAGQSGINYSFTGAQNIYLRRTVISGPCTKVSNTVYIIVQPPLGNNNTAADQQICYNDTPVMLTGSTPTGGDGSNYFYQWQSSTNNGANWNTINGANNINYQPAALTVTTQFRRIVTSALCNGGLQNASNAVTITVTPQNNNTLTSASTQNICTGTNFSYHPTAQQGNTVFTWVSSASPNVSGNSASGTGDINDFLVNSDALNNGTVTYTITPINNNCPGIPFTLTVTVTPRPVITATPTSNTICSGQAAGISFTANLSGTLYRWTSSASAGIYGNSNQPTGNTSFIGDILTNNTVTNGTVTYQITPVSTYGCEGTPVTVVVTIQPPPIQANAGPDQQLCAASTFMLNGNNPAPFTGTWTITSGQTSVAFADASQYNTSVSGLQPGQNYTFRWTISGAGLCAPTYDEVAVTNLIDLTNNISYANPAICYGQTVTILGDQPTGGTNNYTNRWESSTDNVTWATINNQTGRNLTATLTASTYFRRIVTSGACVKVSNTVYIIVQPAISSNQVTADQLICYNNVPSLLNGSTPTGADGNYLYQWQKSTNSGVNWTDISGATNINYQPTALTSTTLFRRIVTSALCNGPQQNVSNFVTITVKALNTNSVTSANSRIICTGLPLNYHPTARQANTVFTWVSLASANITGNSASGTGDINDVLINSDPNNDGSVTYIITPNNNNCPGTPFALTVTVTPIPQVFITSSGNQICSGNPTGITFRTNMPGVVLVKWVSAAVQGVSGNTNQYPVVATRIDDVLTTTLTVPVTIVYHITPVSPGGCDGQTVDATVTILPQAVQANAGPDEQICNATTYTLKGNNPSPSTGRWTITSGQTSVGFADATQYNTAVSGLQSGQNYTFRWTITSTGGCSTSIDEVTISDLLPLSNNISFGNPAVCSGQTITVIGNAATGGTGSFVYTWESSADNISWTTIAGQNGKDYSFTGTQSIYVRRIVTSGPCVLISQPVYIIVQQPITSNTIGSNQQVCYGFTPALLTGSTPAGADGNFSYQWQSSTDNGASWTNINGANTINYQPASLTVSTQYRRVVTSALCTGPQQSISNAILLMVNPLAVASFTYTGDLGCIPYLIDANNVKATVAAGNNTYAWYADGVFIGSGAAFPGYTITQDDKQVVIKLIVTSKFGCPDASFTHTFSTIKEVIAGFTQDQTKGCGPLAVAFTNTSNPQNQATYNWNFGNGSTSTLANPAPVTFLPRPDRKDTTYVVTLKAMTTCGIRTFTSTVTVRPKPLSIFTPDKTIGCSPLTVNFNNTSPGTNNTYTFDFGDGQTLVTHDNQPVVHTYTSPASKTYVVKMTADNECGTSTTQYNIRISPNTVLPQLVVNGDQKAGCAPWTVQFYNNTKGGTYFTYDFGDGTTLATLNAPEVVTHTFLKDGIYNVKLTATNGCADTSTYQSITVFAQPKTDFTSDVQNGCSQLTVNFSNRTVGDNTYNWDFGDGSTSKSINPTHTFAARITPYTISLITRNGLGCTDTMTLKDYITVAMPPKAAFIVKPDSVISYPYYSFSFADKTTNNPILWIWRFGDGLSESKQNPEHTYRDTGSYTVKLIVYNLEACADSVTHIVRITGVPGQLFVPNAFMPTSKFNEVVTFKAKGSGLKTWRMRVFNKWGQVIWETTKLTDRGEPAEGWDGMMNGAPAPQGVYVWQIEATYINGNEWKGMSYKGSGPSKTGFIHLIQ